MTSEATRSGLSAETLERAVLENLICLSARYPEVASPQDWFRALAFTVRDRILVRWAKTTRTYAERNAKVACYLSAEFLMGPQLGHDLLNLGIETNARQAMRQLGQDLDGLLELEEEPGLGNGGLGRLAACYLDSLATLELPAIGAAGVEAVKRDGYRPAAVVDQNPALRSALELVLAGHFSRGDREVFRPLVLSLLESDPFLVLEDFADYAASQERVSAAWHDRQRWTQMSILNSARSGRFSSDRAIAEYAREIWKVEPVKIRG